MEHTMRIILVSVLFVTLAFGQMTDDMCSYGGYGHGCLNDGQCATAYDEIYCECPDGWTGDYCETEMLSCGGDVLCLNGGECIESQAGNECDCPEGYTGKICETEIDCVSDDDCLNGGTCDGGTDRCTCLEGVTGYHCERIYPKCNCSDTIECIDDECPCCCEDEGCVVPPTCEVYGAVIGHGCMNGAQCASYPADLQEFDYCDCNEGYTGRYCETEILECSPDLPCLNGGECIEDEYGIDCNCPEPYTGDLCETEMLYCSDDAPCQHGGTCMEHESGNDCECAYGYTGYLCETAVPTCNCVDTIECVDDVCPCCCEDETCVDPDEPTEDPDSATCTASSGLAALLAIALAICEM